MRFRFPLLLLALITLLLGACTTGNDASIESVLEVITVQTTPSLAHWLDDAAACANSMPGIGTYANVQPIGNLDPYVADLTIRLGNPLDTDPFVTILGTETIVIIAGPDVPVTSLSPENLQAIFAGDIAYWRDIPEVSSAEVTTDEPVSVLSYPKGNDLRSHFVEIYLESDLITDNAIIFYTADALTVFFNENPTSIAYALASQVPSTAQILTVTGFEETAPDIYVIAITQEEPEEGIHFFLLCLQSTP